MIHYLGYTRIIFLKRALQFSIFNVTLSFHFILPIFSYFLFFSSTNSFILSSFKFSSSELHQVLWHFQESGLPSCWTVHLRQFSSGRDTWKMCPQVSNNIPHCAPSLSCSPLFSGNNVYHSILKVNRLECSQTKAKLYDCPVLTKLLWQGLCPPWTRVVFRVWKKKSASMNTFPADVNKHHPSNSTSL